MGKDEPRKDAKGAQDCTIGGLSDCARAECTIGWYSDFPRSAWTIEGPSDCAITADTICRKPNCRDGVATIHCEK